MSIGDLINDAVAWVSEEIQRSIDDISDSAEPSEKRIWESDVAGRAVRSYAPPRAVALETLTNWQEEKTPFDEEDHGTSRRTHDASGGSTAAHSPANSKGSGGLLSEDVDVFPFKVDSGINQRMFVYDGDILALRTDCIMCFTVDGFCGSEGLAGRLLSICGEDLYTELTYQDPCRAGEARMCRSFNLPSTHILYTVTPRFTSKYVTATHNAFNSSIREGFFLMKEGNLRTVAIPCLTPKFALMQRMELKKTRHAADAEPDTTASLGGEYCVMHTLLRSVRRWLEKMQSDIDAVVLVPLSPSDAVIYRQYMKAYFPRNKVEEIDSPFLLPREVGNESGEIDVAERRIRLLKKSDNPGSHSGPARISRGTTFGGMLALRAQRESDGETSSDDNILDSTDVSFRVAQNETETEKRLDLLDIKVRPGSSTIGIDSSETIYQSYLRQANLLAESEAGEQLQQLQFIYPSGFDNAGRPIVVFLAAVFPAATVDSFVLLLHIIRTLDPFIRDKYTLLYVNSGIFRGYYTHANNERCSLVAVAVAMPIVDVHHSNTPGMSLWSEFFGIMQKYEDNLDQLLVLHPGLLFKAAFTCCWPYLASHVWNGTVYLKSIKELMVHVGTRKPVLPKYVHEYDAKPKRRILGLAL